MDKSLQLISHYAASLSYDDLPASTVQAVKQKIVDSMACALGGYLLEAGKAVRRLCPIIDSSFSARIIGSLQRSTPEMAAFANATMVRDLDHSDVYHPTIGTGGHPSNTICAPLAMAEAVNGGGKSLITAIALAYEMYDPFVEGSAKINSQFESDGLMATLGSAMAVGKVLGLTEEQLGTTASLAIAPNVGLGMRRVGDKVSMYKQVYAGMAARQGIFAALMAQAGITAPEETIEAGQAGLKKVVMEGGILEVELLGSKKKQYVIERAIIKNFPFGGGVQMSIRAALELREKVRADEIASLIVKTENYGIETSTKPQHWAPKTRETADHSIPLAVAMALIDGNITADTWKRERFKDPDVMELVGKIRVEEEPEFTKEYPAKKNIIIEAKTHSGDTRMVHKIVTPEDDKPTDELVEAKFLHYADNVLTPAQARASLDAMWHLEELDRAGQILDNLLI